MNEKYFIPTAAKKKRLNEGGIILPSKTSI
jgi:hypothetical protein